MKFYEVNGDYYTLIKAKNEEKAVNLYKILVAYDDEHITCEEVNNVSALSKVFQIIQDKHSSSPQEISESLMYLVEQLSSSSSELLLMSEEKRIGYL